MFHRILLSFSIAAAYICSGLSLLQAQIRLDKTVVKLQAVEFESTGQETVKVIGATAATRIAVSIIYAPTSHQGWLTSAIGNGGVTFSAKAPTRGTYHAYVDILVGQAAARVLVILTSTPSDNQFQFLDASGNDLGSDGLSLSRSAPQTKFRIRFDPQDGKEIPKGFRVRAVPYWLQVSPSSGSLNGSRQAELSVSVAPGAKNSAVRYEGAIGVEAENNTNQSGSLPVSALLSGPVSGTQLSSGDSAGITMLEGNRLYNGEDGFTVVVPSTASKLGVFTDIRDVRMFIRYGTDVVRSGNQVIADATSASDADGQTIELSSDYAPFLQAGTYYIAIFKPNGGESTGNLRVLVTDRPACNFTLSSSSGSIESAAGSGSFQIRTGPGCQWSATTTSTWIKVDPATATGSGDATIRFTYSENSGAARDGTIIAGGQTFRLAQAARRFNPPLITQFSSNADSIAWGNTATLEWAVTNASEVKLDGESVGSSGTRQVSPAQRAVYSLTATNADGTSSRSLTVQVTDQPAGGRGILRVAPNPVLSSSRSGGTVELSWVAPSEVQNVEIRVNTPDGAKLADGGTSGSVVAGDWLVDGTVFFLQDVTSGKAAVAANTLDVAIVRLVPPTDTFFGSTPVFNAPNQPSGVAELTWNAPGYSQLQIRIGSPTGTPMTGELSSTGSSLTGDWATPGTKFYLQDYSSGDSSGAGKTIATVTAPNSITPNPTPVSPSTVAPPLTFWAEPNPLSAPSGVGKTTLRWKVSGASRVQIRLFSPDGPAMTGEMDPEGSVETGEWVTDGLRLFLQDASSGNSFGAERTLADITLRVVR